MSERGIESVSSSRRSTRTGRQLFARAPTRSPQVRTTDSFARATVSVVLSFCRAKRELPSARGLLSKSKSRACRRANETPRSVTRSTWDFFVSTTPPLLEGHGRFRFPRIRRLRGFGVIFASHEWSNTHLVDQLQPVLVLGALVRELDGGRGERRRRREHDRGGGGERERL